MRSINDSPLNVISRENVQKRGGMDGGNLFEIYRIHVELKYCASGYVENEDDDRDYMNPYTLSVVHARDHMMILPVRQLDRAKTSCDISLVK